MRKFLFAFTVTFIFCSISSAQVAQTGRWRVTGTASSPVFTDVIDVDVTNTVLAQGSAQNYYTKISSGIGCTVPSGITFSLAFGGSGPQGPAAMWTFSYQGGGTNGNGPPLAAQDQMEEFGGSSGTAAWSTNASINNSDPHPGFQATGTGDCNGIGSATPNNSSGPTASGVWYAPLNGTYGAQAGSTQIVLNLVQSNSGLGDFGLQSVSTPGINPSGNPTTFPATPSYGQITNACSGTTIVSFNTNDATTNAEWSSGNSQSAAVGAQVFLYGADSSGRIFVATGSSLDTNNDSISLSWSFTGAGCNLSGTSTFVTAVNGPLAGKWVLFEYLPSPSPSAAGHKCFAFTVSCYYAFADIVEDSSGNLSSSSDVYNPGTELVLDNANCSSGTPNLSGSVVGNAVSLDLTEILGGTSNGRFDFTGNYVTAATYTGFNLDGTPSPFSGPANVVFGTNSGSVGCPASDNGSDFQAWQYPSLGNSTVTMQAISQPGTLNLPVSVVASLTESADFSLSGSGTLTGPACGPLTFTTTGGLAIGNLEELDATYTNAAGGTGTLSLGFSIVTPYTVSQAQLQAAGYGGSGSGLPLQIWSIDWSASSDGSCTADPIQIGQGVAAPDKKHFGPSPNRGHKKDPRSFFDEWDKHRTKPADDRGNVR